MESHLSHHAIVLASKGLDHCDTLFWDFAPNFLTFVENQDESRITPTYMHKWNCVLLKLFTTGKILPESPRSRLINQNLFAINGVLGLVPRDIYNGGLGISQSLWAYSFCRHRHGIHRYRDKTRRTGNAEGGGGSLRRKPKKKTGRKNNSAADKKRLTPIIRPPVKK